MTAKYWQKGEVLDYKASAAVKNGEVVSLGTRIGVAGEDIAAGETGHLHVLQRNGQEDHHHGLRECAGGLRCRPCGQRRRNRTGEAAGLKAGRKGT